MTDDHQLLRQYAADGSEAAFRELVARHVNFVYSTALRQTGGDSQMAQDTAQLVFADLARKARHLSANMILSGWLHRATLFSARQLVRAEHRRRKREQEAVNMNSTEPESVPDWGQIRPLLDEGLERLSREDRNAVLLRFFEQRSLAEVGATLGTNEDAARKRVNRALEKLRAFLARRGIQTTMAAFSAAISANCVHAAPAAWAATLADASLAATSTSATTSITILKLMTLAKTQIIAAVGVFIALAVGGAAYLGATPQVPSLAGAELQINPGQGVGPIKLGMDMAEVEKRLGKAGPGGIYPSLGMSVTAVPSDATHVAAILLFGRNGMDVPAGSPESKIAADVKDFAGATKEGIHIGSTGPEVIQAYGKPEASDVMAGGWELLNYRSIGLSLTLRDGQVRAMVVGKPLDPKTFLAGSHPVEVPSPSVPTSDWVVEPKVGIGPIKFGMTAPQVEEILGKPIQIGPAVKYEYYQDGIVLTFGKEGRPVFAMGVLGAGKPGGQTDSAAGQVYKDFGGATKEGIRLGSSRADVIKAFGEPSNKSDAGSLEMLTYSAEALTIRLEKGKVTELDLLVH